MCNGESQQRPFTMDAAVGTHLFWMLSIGLLIGYLSFLIFKRRGLRLRPSLVIGALGALIVGGAAMILGLAGVNAYAFIGAVGFLFVSNSFRQKKKPIFIDTE